MGLAYLTRGTPGKEEAGPLPRTSLTVEVSGASGQELATETTSASLLHLPFASTP